MIREWNEESLDHRNTLLYAMGISEEDAKRPIIGLVNTWNEMNPGHYPFDKALIAEMKEEIYKLGGLALELPISGICDGICSNTPGDRYTLPARDLVSSEVEMVANLNMLEGMVIMATCDKVVPALRCCWSSRTPARRWASATTPMCWKTARSTCPAPARSC